MKLTYLLLIAFALLVFQGCASAPTGAPQVNGFGPYVDGPYDTRAIQDVISSHL